MDGVQLGHTTFHQNTQVTTTTHKDHYVHRSLSPYTFSNVTIKTIRITNMVSVF